MLVGIILVSATAGPVQERYYQRKVAENNGAEIDRKFCLPSSAHKLACSFTGRTAQRSDADPPTSSRSRVPSSPHDGLLHPPPHLALHLRRDVYQARPLGWRSRLGHSVRFCVGWVRPPTSSQDSATRILIVHPARLQHLRQCEHLHRLRILAVFGECHGSQDPRSLDGRRLDAHVDPVRLHFLRCIEQR